MAPTKKLIQTVELTAPLVPQDANNLMVTGDNNANTIILEVLDGGKPADLTGCNAVAYMIRADGKRPFADGKVVGNTVTVCLNEGFYAMAERYHLFVRLTHTNGTKCTLLWLNGWVKSEGSGELIDTGEAVPNLDDLLAQIAAMEDATARALEAAAIAESKLDKNLGAEHAGQVMYVDSNGDVKTTDISDLTGNSVVVDATLTKSGMAADAAVVGKKVSELSEKKADKAYMVALFDELKALILSGDTESAVALLDHAILDNAVLA